MTKAVKLECFVWVTTTNLCQSPQHSIVKANVNSAVDSEEEELSISEKSLRSPSDSYFDEAL